MPIPTLFSDLSTTPASNSPAGSDSPTVLDDHQRALYAFIASVYANSGNGWTSPYLTAASPSYTGTLTGGTGVVNIGSQQIYKDASGNVGFGVAPAQKHTVYTAGATASFAHYVNGTTGPGAANGFLVGVDSVGSGNINSQNGDVVVFGLNVERMRVKSTGQVKFYPLSSAPSGAAEGDIYYDSTTHKHYGYNGSGWQALY